MFTNEHHQLIHRVLNTLDPEPFVEHSCFFGGGTLLALAYGEYRTSVDIDFLCSAPFGPIKEHFRNRKPAALGNLQTSEIRVEKDKISFFVIDGSTNLKFEILQEDRIVLENQHLEYPTVYKEK